MQPAATGAQPMPDSGAPGLLDDSNAGLGANIWQGSSGAQLVSLMPKLAAPQTQPSLRDLQLRLLLTKAPGPNAGGGVDTLVPLRAERLHAMGFSAEAMLLTKGAANAAPADAKGAFEKALSGQDADAACAKVDEVVASPQTLDLYWRKALLFCQIQRGQKDQASLGLDLIRETPDKDAGTKDFIALSVAAARRNQEEAEARRRARSAARRDDAEGRHEAEGRAERAAAEGLRPCRRGRDRARCRAAAQRAHRVPASRLSPAAWSAPTS